MKCEKCNHPYAGFHIVEVGAQIYFVCASCCNDLVKASRVIIVRNGSIMEATIS
jgi:hypothetical protein